MADFEGWAQVWPEQVVDHRPLPRLPRWLASDTVAGGKFRLKRRGRAMKLGTHLTWLWSSEICLVLGFEKGGVETAVMSISNMFSNTVQSWTKNFPTTGVSSMRRVASLSPSWQGLRTLNGQQQNPRNLLLRSFATGSLRERFLDFQSLRKYLSLQVWCVGDWWRDYGFLDGSLAGKENKRTTEGEAEMIGNTHKWWKLSKTIFQDEHWTAKSSGVCGGTRPLIQHICHNTVGWGTQVVPLSCVFSFEVK